MITRKLVVTVTRPDEQLAALAIREIELYADVVSNDLVRRDATHNGYVTIGLDPDDHLPECFAHETTDHADCDCGAYTD